MFLKTVSPVPEACRAGPEFPAKPGQKIKIETEVFPMSMFDRQNLAAWMASDDPWLNRLAESVARRLADPALAAEDVKQRGPAGRVRPLEGPPDQSRVPEPGSALGAAARGRLSGH